MNDLHEPILKEIANNFLLTADQKRNFTEKGFFNASYIFHTVLMNKMYELQDYDKMPEQQRIEMAIKCGDDLRKFIHTYTGLDTFELAKL